MQPFNLPEEVESRRDLYAAGTKPLPEKPRTIAVTVKLDSRLYELLKTYGARTRRSNQDILVDLLERFLK